MRINHKEVGLKIRSFATEPNQSRKVATISFKDIPTCVKSPNSQLTFCLDEDEDSHNSDENDGENDSGEDGDIIKRATLITVDTHFQGLTTLKSLRDESKHKLE